MKTTVHLLPRHKRMIRGLGERLKLARLRRRQSAQIVAERAGISRATLTRIEAGDENVSFANIFQVLHVLGLEADIDRIAEDDEMGRKLQDLDLLTPKRAPRIRGEE